MCTKPVGIAVIGSGGIAKIAHLPAYSKLRDEGKVDIIALADVNEETAKEAAAKFNVSNIYTDYAALLQLPEVDAVSVCTPNYLHMQTTIDALNAGKHVLVEKPIALNAVEGAAMLYAAERNNKKLQVGLNLRYGQYPQAIKRFINDGKLGDIYFARAHALRRRGIPGWGVFTQKDKQGGGPLIDIGVHILDLTLWMMGHPEPASVTGQTYTKFGTREGVIGLLGKWDPKIFTVEDFAAGFVRFKNGATLVLESSFCANIEKDEFSSQIMGTEGGAILDPFDGTRNKLFREESGSLIDSVPFPLPNYPQTHELEIRAFIQAIADDTPVEVPGEQGLMVTRILDAIYESSETGKEILL